MHRQNKLKDIIQMVKQEQQERPEVDEPERPKVADYLSLGSDKAVLSSDLCRLLNVNRRQLQYMIYDERQDGYPICANTSINPGYFLAANKAELLKYCASLQRRAGNIHRIRRACLKTAETMTDKEPSHEGTN